MPRQIVVLGPPGTGKTTASVLVASEWFKKGAFPEHVAYLAFTRAAANEAASRIKGEKLGLGFGPDEKLPYFRTLHSLAYRGLRQRNPDLKPLATDDMKNFARWSGLDGTYATAEFEDLSEVYQRLVGGGRTKWDDCLTAYGISRISARTPEQLQIAKTRTSRKADALMGRCFEQDEYRLFVSKYEDYKKANGRVDFTDMLEFALCEMDPVESVRHVIVDEVQDCAPLLFSICDRLFEGAEEVWWAGDVNQTIYSFAAADPRLFIDRARRASQVVTLRQTHRFGAEIVDFSTQIIRQAKDRILVDVIGKPGMRHSIRTTGTFEPRVADMLILHRHVMGCQAVASSYLAAGMPFRNERGKDPLGAGARVEAFKALYALAEGKEVPIGQAARVVEDLMPSVLQPEPGQKGKRLVVHGAKKKLQDGAIKGDFRVQDLIQAKILTYEGADLIRSGHYQALRHADDLEYYRRVVENGHELDPDAKIPHITTIHGSKGREAPFVTVFTEMGNKCWDQDPDSEHRLAYVAATRTKGDVEICAERTVNWAQSKYDYPVASEQPPWVVGQSPEEVDFDA